MPLEFPSFQAMYRRYGTGKHKPIIRKSLNSYISLIRKSLNWCLFVCKSQFLTKRKKKENKSGERRCRRLLRT